MLHATVAFSTNRACLVHYIIVAPHAGNILTHSHTSPTQTHWYRHVYHLQTQLQTQHALLCSHIFPHYPPLDTIGESAYALTHPATAYSLNLSLNVLGVCGCEVCVWAVSCVGVGVRCVGVGVSCVGVGVRCVRLWSVEDCQERSLLYIYGFSKFA